MAIVLPYLESLRLKGFGALFTKDDITFDLEKQLYVILGGNGLGKTTILQCLVYGLAGALDEAIEPQNNLRWNHEYFKGRLTKDRHKTATVEVSFRLGHAVFRVQRGFTRSGVTGFQLNVGTTEVLSEPSSPNDQYCKAVRHYGDYEHYDDFRFLVHRLLYLAEDRRGITWDLDAQVRILMLLNPEAIQESVFRDRRAHIKKLDSLKRHANVRVGHLRKAMGELESSEPHEAIELSDEDIVELGVVEPTLPPDDLSKTQGRLSALLTDRETLTNHLTHLEAAEQELRSTVSGLVEQRRRSEARILAKALADTEAASVLYLHKLLHRAICPACGQRAKSLQELAIERVKQQQCPICGVGDSLVTVDDDVDAVDSQLGEKMRAKNEVDLQISDLRYQLNEVLREESQLSLSYEVARLALPPTPPPSKSFDPNNLVTLPQEVLAAELERNRQEHERLSILLQQERATLQDAYEEYLSSAQLPIERLVQRFEDLAYHFLGTRVTLVTRRADDRFLGLELFVPDFAGTIRETPEHCSEAQRFFLDIAMRLAVLQLAAELCQHPNSFVCETPESVLDVSYVDNAATMFRQFVARGHSLVASTNLQRLGLAYRLLENATSSGLSYGVFDMLEHSALLTDVQKNSGELHAIRNQIVEVSTK